MDYIEVSFCIEPSEPGNEILIAELAEIGFESFEEVETGVLAYIPDSDYNKELLESISVFSLDGFTLSYEIKTITQKNWNEVWESNFQPVAIKNTVGIRAPFHVPDKSLDYDIIIEPKMSFGTAHHETTAMMIELMIDEKLNKKKVLDMGCGTGILAVLAEKLGAWKIKAVDNDSWAFENTKENIQRNNCKCIDVQLGDCSVLTDVKYDIILANINRNILLSDMQIYADKLINGGIILFSGFYLEDLMIIESEAKKYALQLNKRIEKNNWTAARFIKR